MEKTEGGGFASRGRAHGSTSYQGIGQSHAEAPMGRGQGRVFTLNPQEAQTTTNVVTGTFTIEHMHARTLFNSRATHSFISPYFAKKLSKESRKMENSLIISTPLQDSIVVDHMYPACLIEIENRKLPTNLIELPVLRV